jgi:hypothetical protein
LRRVYDEAVLKAGEKDGEHVADHEHPGERFAGLLFLTQLLMLLDTSLKGRLLLIDLYPIDEHHACLLDFSKLVFSVLLCRVEHLQGVLVGMAHFVHLQIPDYGNKMFCWIRFI